MSDSTEPGALVATVSRHPVATYLAGLAPGSRRTMAGALKTIAAIASSGTRDAYTLDWTLIAHEHTVALRSVLETRYAPATANKHLAALRGVLKEAWAMGQMEADRYHRAAAVKSIRSERQPAGRGLHSGELRALFDVCASDGAAGARDAAALALLYGAGMRRAEVAAIQLDDFNRDTGEVRVRSGKGRKDRTVWATHGAKSAISGWIELRGGTPGPLLVPVYDGHIKPHRGLTDQAILYIVRKRAEQAGVARFSPHDMRRSFVSDLLDAGVDINTVRQLAGHASVTTTARYDRRGEQVKRKAAEMLHVPWKG